MKADRVAELEDKLKTYREAYYNGDPLVTDDVYDAYEDALRALAPKHPLLNQVGVSSGDTKWSKVSHEMPMTSLNKVNSSEQLGEWADKAIKSVTSGGQRLDSYTDCFAWSEKLDGISLALYYEEGDLKRAVTRGDGLVGEDIMANAVLMRGVIRQLPENFTGSIRGEVVLTHNQFEAHFEDYSNPRNAASGIAKREDRQKAQMCQYLTVMVYDVASQNVSFDSEQEKFTFLKALGFKTPSHGFNASPEDIEQLYQQYEETLRDELHYDIDGLVIRFQSTRDFRNAGERSGNPHGAVALKFANEGAVTTLQRIIWQVGNTGRLTPVAEFDPVELVGAEVRRASCYNLKYLLSLGVAAGDDILVVRANDVIPRVEKVVGKRREIAIAGPIACPVCEGDVDRDGEYLVCSNSLGCPAQAAGRIKRWIESLNILDWGDFVIEELVEQGLVNGIQDLYELEAEQIAELTNANDAVVGMKTAKKLLRRLRAKSEDATFDAVVGGLSIPHCRKSTAQKLMKAGYTDFDSLANASVAELSAVEGLGDVKAAAIHEGMQDAMPTVSSLTEKGHVILKESEGPLAGLTFCVTGSLSKPRKHIERDITEAGARMKSVSKSLDYLVTNDHNSSSSKARKARKYEIPFLTEDQLYEMLRGT